VGVVGEPLAVHEAALLARLRLRLRAKATATARVGE
jgi:hypothetical protein